MSGHRDTLSNYNNRTPQNGALSTISCESVLSLIGMKLFDGTAVLSSTAPPNIPLLTLASPGDVFSTISRYWFYLGGYLIYDYLTYDNCLYECGAALFIFKLLALSWITCIESPAPTEGRLEAAAIWWQTVPNGLQKFVGERSLENKFFVNVWTPECLQQENRDSLDLGHGQWLSEVSGIVSRLINIFSVFVSNRWLTTW